MKKFFSVSHLLLLATMLMLAAMSCDIDGGGIQPEGPSQPTNPQEPTEPNQPNSGKTHYSDYENFNPADYPILNESGKSDSAIAGLKDFIWLMYAEKEDIGEWTANYIKSNHIKTILSNEYYANAWINPSQLDRIYISENDCSMFFGFYNDSQYDDNDRANMRKNEYKFFTHETMHLVQYGGNAFNLMKGMRPDICAAVNMLTEYLAWFYTETRDSGTDITADMKDALERQSDIMIRSTDPWNDPNPIHVTPWFANELGTYAGQAFQIGIVRENAMTPPLRQASKGEMLEVARAMLACRDPKQAGVTDEALWTVFDALLKAAVGNSKYLPNGLSQDVFNAFQDFIAAWDEEYAAQEQGVSPSVSMNLAAAAIVW